jgi:CHASE2 domain-containing sensor protein
MTNDDTTPPSQATDAPRPRRSARFGTIFWGVVLLVFALAVAVPALPWFSVDPVTLLLVACITAGVLLVVAGVAAVVARPRR